MNWIKDIFSGLMTPVTKYIEGKNIVNEIEAKTQDKKLDRVHELNIKKIEVAHELAKQGQKIEADWDTNAQEDMKTSWKDEYLTLLLSIPLILAFIPATQEAVLRGFEILGKTPEWYMVFVGGIVASAFGLRWLLSRGK